METATLFRIAAMAVLTIVAFGVAWALQRRRPDPPSAPSYRAPSQLDRDDFADPAKPVLAVEFASTGCLTCPEVWRVLQPLSTDRVSVQRVDVETDSQLHQRYRIDGVPTTVIAGADGAVVHAFFGPVGSEDLQAALASLD